MNYELMIIINYVYPVILTILHFESSLALAEPLLLKIEGQEPMNLKREPRKKC